MRFPTLLLLAGLSTSALLTGCGEGPNRAAQSALDQAMAQLNTAEQGYITGGSADMTLEAYRLQEMQKAIADLDTAISQGGPAEKVIASRLKASVLLTQARAAARQGSAAYSDVGARAGSVVRYLDAINRAAARITRLDQDRSGSVEQLQQTRQQQQQQQQQVASTLSELKQNIQALQQQQSQLKEQANTLVADAQDLRSQAFVANGQKQAELEDLAAQRQLESQRKQSEGDKVATQLHQLNSQLRLVQAEHDLLGRSAQTLSEMIQGVQQGEQVSSQNLAKAQTDRQDAVSALTTAFDELWQRYQDRVQTVFSEADAKAQQAVSTMQQAVTSAETSEQRQSAQRGLLEALTTRASILADQAMATGGFGGSVQVLAQHTRSLAPQAAQRFQQAYDQLRQSQQQTVAAATTVLENGQQLAGNLAGDTTQPQAQSLAYYAQQISQSTLE